MMLRRRAPLHVLSVADGYTTARHAMNKLRDREEALLGRARQRCRGAAVEAARPPGQDDDHVAAREVREDPLQFEGVVGARRLGRGARGDAVLVDDRDPPHAASARLPEPEADLDPVVARPAAEQRRGASSAVADHAQLIVAAADTTVIVSARVGGSGGAREYE